MSRNSSVVCPWPLGYQRRQLRLPNWGHWVIASSPHEHAFQILMYARVSPPALHIVVPDFRQLRASSQHQHDHSSTSGSCNPSPSGCISQIWSASPSDVLLCHAGRWSEPGDHLLCVWMPPVLITGPHSIQLPTTLPASPGYFQTRCHLFEHRVVPVYMLDHLDTPMPLSLAVQIMIFYQIKSNDWCQL